MRIPDLSTGVDRLYEYYGLYHLARLRADDAMTDLVEPFEEAQGMLQTRIEENRTARFQTMIAQGVRDAADDELDDSVRELFFELLRVVVNNREHPLFLRYFPEGMTQVIEQPLQREVQDVGILITKLAEETDPALTAHRAKLQAVTEKLSIALDKHQTARSEEKLAKQKLQEEKLAWLDAYRRSYRELARRFYKEPKRADRYFRSAKKVGRVTEEEETEAVEPNPTPEVVVADRAGELDP